MTLRLIYNATDATVIFGAVGGWMADALPTWAAAVAIIYTVMLAGEWLGLWTRPRR